ncbi:hypothetical protein FQR65_LT19540 [Abscondita terminalis]|nr:hypothetical protein FQR65_LT19540 [Abscondita terminalis]
MRKDINIWQCQPSRQHNSSSAGLPSTAEGIEVKETYQPEHWHPGTDRLCRRLRPNLRGPYATMYVRRPWDDTPMMLDFLTAEEEETKICKTVDPWAGSYYVESLTAEIAEKAWKLIEEVEELGGMTKAIEAGIPKLRIEEAAARKQARIDSGQDIIVGVNKYRLEKEKENSLPPLQNFRSRTSKSFASQQIERLKPY